MAPMAMKIRLASMHDRCTCVEEKNFEWLLSISKQTAYRKPDAYTEQRMGQPKWFEVSG